MENPEFPWKSDILSNACVHTQSLQAATWSYCQLCFTMKECILLYTLVNWDAVLWFDNMCDIFTASPVQHPVHEFMHKVTVWKIKTGNMFFGGCSFKNLKCLRRSKWTCNFTSHSGGFFISKFSDWGQRLESVRLWKPVVKYVLNYFQSCSMRPSDKLFLNYKSKTHQSHTIFRFVKARHQ